MGLDLLGRLGLRGGGLDDVGVERALGQEVDPPEAARLLLEDADELVPDDAPLALRVLDAGQAGEEALAGVDHHQAHAKVGLEGRPQELGFLLAHEPVVDVDAGQAVAHGAMDEGGRDGRVDPAREGADDPPFGARGRSVGVDALADGGHGGGDEVAGGPGGVSAGDAEDEVAQDVPPGRRVDDLGVELDAVEPPVGIGQAGERRGGRQGGRMEADGWPRDEVAVAHPDGLLAGHVLEQPVRLGDRHGRRAVLAVGRRQHLAAELVGHQLDAVADAEDGDAGAPQARIDARRVRVVDAGRPTREDDAAGVACPGSRPAACRAAGARSRPPSRARAGR